MAGNSVDMAGWSLRNPIPDLASDKGDLIKLFEIGKFLVPYTRAQNGKSAHATLSMLYSLSTLSGIFKTVINSKLNYCFGSGFDNESNGSISSFFEKININNTKISDLAASLYRDEVICGSLFLLVQIVEINGVYSVTLSRIPPTNCLPAFDFNNEKSEYNGLLFYTNKQIGNDFSFSTEKLKTEWKSSGIFPKVTKRGRVFETVFQINNQGYEDEFWGRPVTDIHWIMTDYLQSSAAMKIAASEVTSKVLLFLKEPGIDVIEQTGRSPDEVKRDIVGSLRRTITNRGDSAESLGAIFYDDEMPKIERVDINRDSQYFSTIRESCVQSICASLGISASLSGLEPLKVGFGGNVVLDTFITTNINSIVPVQNKYEELFNMVFEFIVSVTGGDAPKVKFSNSAEKIIEQITSINGKKTVDNNGTINTATGSN